MSGNEVDYKKMFSDIFTVLYDIKLLGSEISYEYCEPVRGRKNTIFIYVQWPYNENESIADNKEFMKEVSYYLDQYGFKPKYQSIPKSNLISTKIYTDGDRKETEEALESAGFIKWNGIKNIREEREEKMASIKDLFKKMADRKLNEGADEDSSYEYEGHKISKDESFWFVDEDPVLRFSTDKEAEEFIDELESLEEDTIVEEDSAFDKAVKDRYNSRIKSLEKISNGIQKAIDSLKKSLENPESFKTIQDIEDKEITVFKDLQDSTGLDFLGILNEESNTTELPKEDCIYWDKKHENAYLVVQVYEKDNKVSYWSQDGDRHETTIDLFQAKYEPSTNEDDYELFYEDKEN